MEQMIKRMFQENATIKNILTNIIDSSMIKMAQLLSEQLPVITQHATSAAQSSRTATTDAVAAASELDGYIVTACAERANFIVSHKARVKAREENVACTAAAQQATENYKEVVRTETIAFELHVTEVTKEIAGQLQEVKQHRADCMVDASNAKNSANASKNDAKASKAASGKCGNVTHNLKSAQKSAAEAATSNLTDKEHAEHAANTLLAIKELAKHASASADRVESAAQTVTTKFPKDHLSHQIR